MSQERTFTTTRWKNENPFPQSVTLDGDRYTWQPGEEMAISSKYDDAIQRIHGGEMVNGRMRGGTVVGGLAPKLTNLSVIDGDRAVLHESLDPAIIEKKEAEAQAMIAARDAQNAATLATIAQANADKVKPSAKK